MVQRVRELEIRYRPLRLPLPVQREVHSPQAAADIAQQLLNDLPFERAVALHLDARRRLVGVHRVSDGTIDTTFICPREVLTAALMSGAASVILAHNHPSGDPTPSPDDFAMSRRLGRSTKTDSQKTSAQPMPSGRQASPCCAFGARRAAARTPSTGPPSWRLAIGADPLPHNRSPMTCRRCSKLRPE